jgi:hypothetical protein
MSVLSVSDGNPFTYLRASLCWWIIVYGSLLCVVYGVSRIILTMAAKLKLQRKTQALQHNRDRLDDNIADIAADAVVSSLELILTYIKLIVEPNVKLTTRSIFYFIQAILSTLISISTISQFAERSISVIWSTSRVVLCAFFILHYFVRAKEYVGPVHFYMISIPALVDSLTIVSMFVSFDFWLSWCFLRSVLAINAIQRLKPVWSSFFRISDVQAQVALVVCDFVHLIFLFATSIYIFENLGNPPGLEDYDFSIFSLFNSVYFSVITALTIGYGDLYAKTVFGRLIVVLFAICGIVIISNQINRLLETIRAQKIGLGKYCDSYGTPFVIVCGNLNWDSIRTLMLEMFHPDARLNSNRSDRKVVFLSKVFEDDAMFEKRRVFLERNPHVSSFSVVLNGTPMSKSDLIERANGKEADALFILADNFSSSPCDDDAANIFRAMHVQRFVPHMRMFMSLADSSSKSLIPSVSFAEQSCIFLDATKMEFCALSHFCPGINSIFFGLCRSYNIEIDPVQYDQADVWSSELEVLSAMDCEFYVVHSKKEFWKKTLNEVALQVYKEFGVLVVGTAVSIPVRSAEDIEATPVMKSCFRQGTKIRKNSTLLIVAQDRKEASLVGEMVKLDDFSNSYSFADDTTDVNNVRETRQTEVTVPPLRPSAISNPWNVSDSDLVEGKVADDDGFQLEDFYGRSYQEGDGSQQSFGSIEFPFPQHDLENHIVIICWHTTGMGHFVRRIRVMEESMHGISKPEASSVDEKDSIDSSIGGFTPIVIVCPNDIDYSSFSIVRTQLLRNMYHVKQKLRHFKQMRDLCLQDARSVNHLSFVSL